MNLYGNDMDESTHPFESASAGRWRWSRASAPSSAARRSRPHRARGSPRKLVGLLLEDRGVLRAHQKVIAGRRRRGRDHQRHLFADAGALDRVCARAGAAAQAVQVDIRGKLLDARIVQGHRSCVTADPGHLTPRGAPA